MKRTNNLQVRLNDVELAPLKRLAEAQRISVAELVREIIRKEFLSEGRAK